MPVFYSNCPGEGRYERLHLLDDGTWHRVFGMGTHAEPIGRPTQETYSDAEAKAWFPRNLVDTPHDLFSDKPKQPTFGWLIAQLETNESTKQMIEEGYRREEAEFGKIGADGWRFRAESFGLFHPDPTTMPGIDRIEHLCDVHFNGTGLTLTSVRQLKVLICQKYKWNSEQARCVDGFTLNEAADLVEDNIKVDLQTFRGLAEAVAQQSKHGTAKEAQEQQNREGLSCAEPNASQRFTDRPEVQKALKEIAAGARYAREISERGLYSRHSLGGLLDDIGKSGSMKIETPRPTAPRRNPNIERDEWIALHAGSAATIERELKRMHDSTHSNWKVIGVPRINAIKKGYRDRAAALGVTVKELVAREQQMREQG